MSTQKLIVLLYATITMCPLMAMEGKQADGRNYRIVELHNPVLEKMKKDSRYLHLPRKYEILCPKYVMDYGITYSAWWKDKKLAILRYSRANDNEQTPLEKAQLTIIDTKKDAVLHNRFLEKRKYGALGVSRSGRLFATVYHYTVNKEKFLPTGEIKVKKENKAMLTIEDNKGERQRILLPDHFIIPNVAGACPPLVFNKTETELLVYKQNLLSGVEFMIVPIEIEQS